MNATEEEWILKWNKKNQSLAVPGIFDAIEDSDFGVLEVEVVLEVVLPFSPSLCPYYYFKKMFNSSVTSYYFFKSVLILSTSL